MAGRSAKRLLFCILILFVFAAVSAAGILNAPVFAEGETPTVRFYSTDTNAAPYAEARAEDEWDFPAAPVRDGYTFQGWIRDNDMGVYAAGSRYTGIAITEDVNFFAAWQEVIRPPEKEPFFTALEWTFILIGLTILLGAIAFAYYWFVLKKRSFKQLFKKKEHIEK